MRRVNVVGGRGFDQGETVKVEGKKTESQFDEKSVIKRS